MPEASNNKVQRPPKLQPRLRFRPVLAACLALFILFGGISGFAITAEAKEYRAAVGFFSENNLSTEGLTRSEIKDVYRDIITSRFTHNKTAQVLVTKVGGQEIFQAEPTPEELEGLWKYLSSGHFFQPPTLDGITYQSQEVYKLDPKLGFDTLDISVVTKLVDDKPTWTAELKDFVVVGFARQGTDVVVYGHNSTWSSLQRTYGRLAMLDGDGNVLWDISSDNGFRSEYFSKVLCDEEGITVFSRGDFNDLCYSKYDYAGNILKFTKNPVGNLGILDAVKLGDDYLVQLFGHEAGDLIVKVDKDGNLFESFTYTAQENVYRISSMLPYNGRVYLSAYAFPKLSEEAPSYGRPEIAPILEYIFTEKKMEISPQELTKLVREHYTAVLLVCDPKSGVPSEFFSVKGSLGSTLSISQEGNMLWHVESITDTFFSPATSSFTIGGASYVYRYTFNEAGLIIQQENTGEVAGFRR